VKINIQRKVEVVMAAYIAIGITIIHKAFDIYSLIFSGSCALLTLTVMMSDGKNRKKSERYDSWGWSESATRGVMMTAIIAGVGGLPFWVQFKWAHLVQGELPEIPFWSLIMLVALAGFMAVTIYFRGYLRPMGNEHLDIDILKLEHNEWFGIFQAAGILLGVGFMATGFSYISGLLGQIEPLPLTELSYLIYLTAGYVVWALRPLHGRGKEIRDHINKLKRSSRASTQERSDNQT